jgi:hypothetical protein
LDVPQTLPVCELGESHAKELVPAGKALYLVVAVVTIDAFAKFVWRYKVHQLRKNCFPVIHMQSPYFVMQETCTLNKIISNQKMILSVYFKSIS